MVITYAHMVDGENDDDDEDDDGYDEDDGGPSYQDQEIFFRIVSLLESRISLARYAAQRQQILENMTRRTTH